jgi:hypothetical protein
MHDLSGYRQGPAFPRGADNRGCLQNGFETSPPPFNVVLPGTSHPLDAAFKMMGFSTVAKLV